MNFHYGFSLGRTVHEGRIYGVVGVFAVASNGLCPFLLAWHAKRRALQGAIVLLWVFCLTYSLTSAIGFAAENRDGMVAGREAAKTSYAMTLASLADLEAKQERGRPAATTIASSCARRPSGKRQRGPTSRPIRKR